MSKRMLTALAVVAVVLGIVAYNMNENRQASAGTPQAAPVPMLITAKVLNITPDHRKVCLEIKGSNCFGFWANSGKFPPFIKEKDVITIAVVSVPDDLSSSTSARLDWVIKAQEQKH